MPGDVKQKKLHCKEWLGRFILAVIVSFLALMGWIGWYLRDYEPFTARSYYPARPDSHEVSFIEGNADITLPASAHDIYAYTTGFQEMSIKVRFSMNTDELNTSMASTLCQEPLMEMQPHLELYDDGTAEWWISHQYDGLKGCTGSQDYTHQTVMAAMTDAAVYVVFVKTLIY